jgi:hypothetical protein
MCQFEFWQVVEIFLVVGIEQFFVIFLAFMGETSMDDLPFLLKLDSALTQDGFQVSVSCIQDWSI